MQSNLQHLGDSSFGAQVPTSEQQSTQNLPESQPDINMEAASLVEKHQENADGGGHIIVATEANQAEKDQGKINLNVEKMEPQRKPKLENEEERQRRLKKKQERLRAQLYMSDSEFEVEEEELQRSNRSFRNVTKIDYNENKRVPLHRVVHEDKQHIGHRGKRSRSHNSSPSIPDYNVPELRRKMFRSKSRSRSRSRSTTRKRKESSPELRTTRTRAQGGDTERKRHRGRRRKSQSEYRETKPVEGNVLEIENKADVSNDQEKREKRDKVRAAALEKHRLKEEASKHPLSDFQKKLLEETSMEFLEKLAASDFPAKIQSITENNEVNRNKQISALMPDSPRQKSDYNFLDLNNSEDVSQLQNIIANEYYEMSKKFVEAQVNHIDELVKTIDTCVDESKKSYEQYRKRIDDSKRDYLAFENGKLRGSSKKIKHLINTLETTKLLPALPFPDLFEKLVGWKYPEYSRTKNESFCQLDMIDRITAGNKQIIRDRYERSMKENRESMKLETMNRLRELDSEFIRETGLSPKIVNIDGIPVLESIEGEHQPDDTSLHQITDVKSTINHKKKT